MNCLICQKAMKTKIYEGITIDACDCGGVWLDQEELQPILKSREETFSYEKRVGAISELGQDHQAPAAKACPKCRKPLKRLMSLREGSCGAGDDEAISGNQRLPW